jgi:hypothetical protein
MALSIYYTTKQRMAGWLLNSKFEMEYWGNRNRKNEALLGDLPEELSKSKEKAYYSEIFLRD